MKAFLIAGPASGVGKTTVSLAIAAALRARGLCVQGFKCGPDFLDTGHLSSVTARPARNLDGWMLSSEGNRAVFAEGCTGADFAIVEGMMGLFDGISGQGEKGSPAEIAKLLSVPVILVLDASKSARSIAAVIRGFEVFDPQLRFAGVVLNCVASEGHYRLLADAITQNCITPILGWLPQEKAVHIPERHLGLHTADEMNWPKKQEALRTFVEKRLDLDRLLSSQFDLPVAEPGVGARDSKSRVTIGVARDEAFCFYYQDNLDLLRAAGAAIVEFSPLRDEHLPPGLDALYLGGGYPELYAEQLGLNSTLAAEIRDFAACGRPMYAECGGMMYLGERMRTVDGRVHVMAGVLPLLTEMTEKLVRFGYVEATMMQDSLLGAKGTVVRGHSFHHSQCSTNRELPAAFEARYTLSGKTGLEGYVCDKVVASYIHLHFRGAPGLAEQFVKTAEQVSLRLAEVQ
jgi:cobyrinic acid a,c-diamide synthase